MDALETLVHKAITDYAGTAVRVASLDEAVRDLKTQIAQALTGINESLRMQATILEKLNANIEEHKALHKRIDELEELFDTLDERVDSIEKACARTGHEDVVKKVSVLEDQSRKLDKIYSFLDSKIGYFLLTAIVIGMITDLVYHYDFVKRILLK